MDVANELLDAIEIIVDKKIRENTAQIYPGVCKSVSGNSCVMSINGKDNTIQFYGSIPTVGAIYRVFVPDGNMSMAFAITGNDDRKGLHYSNPNLLDNWYFGNPVNQRGKTEQYGSGYFIDRWTASEGKFALTNNGLTLGVEGVISWISNRLDVDVEGQIITVSALTSDGKLYKGTGRPTKQSEVLVPFDGGGYVSCSYIAGISMFQFTLARYDTTLPITIRAAKLELGSQQTLAHQDADGNWVLNEIPDYGEQLRRCQRYFVNFNPNKVDWFAMPPAVASNTTDAFSAVTLPVAMRAQPTVSYGGKIALSQTGDVQVTDIQVSGSTFAGNYLQLKYSVADGLTANSTYRVQGYNDPTSYIWLSADL